ncbi:helix-turn-helix transcriptional regulator [Streptodolium elevatio]
MPPAEWLPTTTYTILGLLSYERELSGFEVKRWADTSLRFFYWSPATSQVYRELERLADAGLVSSRVVPGQTARSKRVYRITAEGRTELTRWIEEAPVEPTLIRDSVVLRIWLGHMADPERLRELLEEHRARLQALIPEVRKLGELAAVHSTWAYPELVSQWGELQYEAELRGIDLLLAGIDRAHPRGGVPGEADGADTPH